MPPGEIPPTRNESLIATALAFNFLRIVSTAGMSLDDLSYSTGPSIECSRGDACLAKQPIGQVLGIPRWTSSPTIIPPGAVGIEDGRGEASVYCQEPHGRTVSVTIPRMGDILEQMCPPR